MSDAFNVDPEILAAARAGTIAPKQHITLHQRRYEDEATGRTMVEFVLFEMDLVAGGWRKLRRKRTMKAAPAPAAPQ